MLRDAYGFGFPRMTEVIPATPEPEGNGFFIEHHTINEQTARFQSVIGNWTMRGLQPGTFCVLRQQVGANTYQWMSDTHLERSTNYDILRAAEGDVLLAGLGIGMLPVALCRKEEVTSVTVLEIEPKIIRLVEPHIRHPKLTVIQTDAVMPPLQGRRFDTIYLDIWQDICSDNWAEREDGRAMKSMLRTYRKFGRKGALITGWLKEYIQGEANRQERSWY